MESDDKTPTKQELRRSASETADGPPPASEGIEIELLFCIMIH